MTALKTPHDVIQAVCVTGLPEYYDVQPFTNAIGFSVKRHYLPTQPLHRW